MIESKHLSCKKLAVIFKKANQETPMLATRRVAQTLLWLVYCGEKGVTALEVSSWALRLADYVHTLRHDYGVRIITLMEAHDGGRHARYVLREEIVVIDISQLLVS